MTAARTSTTVVSTKGQVVVPSKIRRKLGLQPGDPLEAKIEGDDIVLTPRKIRSSKARVVRDPVTGLPVLIIKKPFVPWMGV